MITSSLLKGVNRLQLAFRSNYFSSFHLYRKSEYINSDTSGTIQVSAHQLRLERTVSTSSHLPKERNYDAVIIGGGHNGLVAAAYLAKSGLKTCVLERRKLVGGAAVTEEIVPGYKFSRASYVLSLLRPKIFKDLELKKHGLKVYLRNPSSYTPLRKEMWKDGGPRSLTLGMNHEENVRQISQFSKRDAQRFGEYEAQLQRFVDAIDPLLDHSPPSTNKISSTLGYLKILPELKPLLKSAMSLEGKDVGKFYEMMTAPTTKILDKWFESEPLKATLATDACIGAMISPNTPGSGYVLLHHVMGELDGVKGAWGYPEGGMGSVSNAIAKSAIQSGAEIVVDAEVEKIILPNSDQKQSGILLKGGEMIHGKVVLSNVTPQKTYLEMLDKEVLPPRVRESIEKIDYKSPVTKINVAVDRLPNFLADPNNTENANEVLPHHRCTIHLNCENSALLEEAYKDATKDGDNPGQYSRNPMIELTIPSSLDPTLAPPGHHVCLFFTQYTPYNLEGGWTKEAKEKYANVIFDTVESYAPGFKGSIVGKEVLCPPVLEETFGLTGGNIFHGSMSLDQLYMTRPIPGAQGSVITPSIPGIYLCGSGAHPGGGVMGAPGRLAAKAVINDMKLKWKYN